MFPDESGQDFHDRRMVTRGAGQDSLERVDRAEAHVHTRRPEPLDRLGVPVGHMASRDSLASWGCRPGWLRLTVSR
jgi:hypothetical protein